MTARPKVKTRSCPSWIQFSGCPPWVPSATGAVLRLKPWRAYQHRLSAVKWLKGKRKTHKAYYNPKTGVIGVFPAWGRADLLLAHELAHVIEHDHDTRRHRQLTNKAARVIASVRFNRATYLAARRAA